MMLEENSILIVDDNPKNVQLLGNVLKEEGYDIEFALSGREALNWVEEKNFDIILLDVMMPDMDGFETIKELHKNPYSSGIPVIFLTAKIEQESIIKGFRLKAVDYILKPFSKDELLARVRTHLHLMHVRKVLEDKNRLIMDSINYAQRIQQSMLPDKQYMKEVLLDHFLFFRPRDVVSGDFFWACKSEGLKCVVVADGTGHGVPGAFMSMLGISLLNEIVTRQIDSDSGRVLDILRDKVKFALQQTEKIDSSRDGMDVSICLLDMKKGILKFSGANLPVYIVRDGELFILNGDRQPIGIHYKEVPFSTQEFSFQKGDVIYMFTDGYQDQFGEETGKKFMVGRFRKLLHETASLEMPEQKLKLKEAFSTWKGSVAQVDDITVLGFRL